jgi:hypothetical protein
MKPLTATNMDPLFQNQLLQTRRQFFGSTGIRLGSLALAQLLGKATASTAANTVNRVQPGLPNLPHFKPKAKALIYIHMSGGPSQLDMWDYKPELQKYYDQELPKSVRGDQRITTMTSGQSKLAVAPSLFKFAQHGKCGRWVSELLPHTAKIVDDIALIKTVHTTAINHDPACTFVMSGSEIPGRASLGTWLSYGLGCDSNNLPAFVCLTPKYPLTSNGQALFSRMWNSGFLPTKHTGVVLRGAGDPVLYLQNPDGLASTERRHMLDALGKLNQQGFDRIGDPEIQTRISQYEMAFRMQSSVPELVDMTKESPASLELYGDKVKESGSFAHSMLMSRRLVERGVRVVQIMHRGWDQHGNLPNDIRNQCKDTDQGVSALIQDLKLHGMLDDTLVIWGGEFGRTVYSQGGLSATNYGRDHHPRNSCMWMAGGGIKPGISLGETDDFSYNVVSDPVSLFDFNATILHCMGIDHEKFTYPFQGLDIRLTGVEPCGPVKQLLA